MEEKNESEKLIGKLIKKRKEENNAFIKLLGAIEKTGSSNDSQKSKKKNKS